MQEDSYFLLVVHAFPSRVLLSQKSVEFEPTVVPVRMRVINSVMSVCTREGYARFLS
jgi:hypothetical protein